MFDKSVQGILQGITPGYKWLEGISLKDYEIIWKIKVREIKTKYYLETLIVLWIKWTGMVEIKHKEFIDVVPIIPCQNTSGILSSRIYGEGRTQICLSSTATLDPLAQDPECKNYKK